MDERYFRVLDVVTLLHLHFEQLYLVQQFVIHLQTSKRLVFVNFYICFFLRTFASSATCQKWLETRNIAITKSDRCVLDTTWYCCTNSGVDPTGIYIYILCDSDVSAKFNCNCAEYIYIPPKIYAKQFVVL